MAGDPPLIPGIMLSGAEAEKRRAEVSRLLRCGNHFPGAQPVSFSKNHLQLLIDEDYYVCEKSDGIRLLLYCSATDDGREAAFLIDRKNTYYGIPRLHFPIPGDSSCKQFHESTILDGELVLDTINGKEHLVYLAFDLLMYRGKDVRQKTLPSRLGTLQELFLKPMANLLASNPVLNKRFPFRVTFKEMQFGYGIEMMFSEVIPKLNHGNDGLIFTSLKAKYTSGTDETLLKWKPADENSVDFRLHLEYETGTQVSESVSEYQLLAYHGEGGRSHGVTDTYFKFGVMHVSEDDWPRLELEKLRHNNTLEGLVVECILDEQKRWRFMRVRDDKQHGNHITVIEKILQSIEDGVTMQELKLCSLQMKKAWKQRHPTK